MFSTLKNIEISKYGDGGQFMPRSSTSTVLCHYNTVLYQYTSTVLCHYITVCVCKNDENNLSTNLASVVFIQTIAPIIVNA